MDEIKSIEDVKLYALKKLLGNKQVQILKYCVSPRSYDDIVKEFGMSKPLLSFYINGNIKNRGLTEISLIDSERLRDNKGRRYFIIKTTDLGQRILELLE